MHDSSKLRLLFGIIFFIIGLVIFSLIIIFLCSKNLEELPYINLSPIGILSFSLWSITLFCFSVFCFFEAGKISSEKENNF